LDGVVESEVGGGHLEEAILELGGGGKGGSAYIPRDHILLVQVEEAEGGVEDVECKFEKVRAGIVCFLDSQIFVLFFFANLIKECEKDFLVY